MSASGIDMEQIGISFSFCLPLVRVVLDTLIPSATGIGGTLIVTGFTALGLDLFTGTRSYFTQRNRTFMRRGPGWLFYA
jgi:hypothetical protein